MSTDTVLSPEAANAALTQLAACFQIDLAPVSTGTSLAELQQGVIEAIAEAPGQHAIHAWVWLELEKGMALTLGIPTADLHADSKMPQLIPTAGRRAAWERLETAVELRLPRLGAPPWLQHILGFLLLAGFVLPFYRLWLGLALFWGVLLASWPLEKQLTGFPYPTFGTMVARTAMLNPQLKLEFSGDDAMVRALVQEVLAHHTLA